MKTVRAVYEKGVFRPQGKVNIPEKSRVEFEPRLVRAKSRSAKAEDSELYDILSLRFESGETDVAARHEEHQP
jgi:predicted DNA-binding antitoxin AbrB/MazE fold protein